MPDIEATWVQAGELGFAFVVVILCAFLIRYVMQASRERETKLLDALMASNAELTKISSILQSLQTDIDERLENIETVLNIKRVKKAKAE